MLTATNARRATEVRHTGGTAPKDQQRYKRQLDRWFASTNDDRIYFTNTCDKVLFLTRSMGPQDRCSVSAFNDKYLELVQLQNENMAKGALLWTLDKCNNATTLWDAITVSCLKHIQTAAGSRPWVFIVLTDGADSGSKLNKSQAVEILQAFNRPSDNFSFVIGLGRDVDTAGLQSLCSSSGSMYIPAEDSSTLNIIFALIALQVRRVSHRVRLQMSLLSGETRHQDQPRTNSVWK